MITQSCHSSGRARLPTRRFSLLRISSGLRAHTRLPVTDGRREHAGHHGPAFDLLGEPSPGTVRSPVRRSRRPTHNPSSAASSRASRPEYRAIVRKLMEPDTPATAPCRRRPESVFRWRRAGLWRACPFVGGLSMRRPCTRPSRPRSARAGVPEFLPCRQNAASGRA